MYSMPNSTRPDQLIKPDAKAAFAMIGTVLIGTGSIYELNHTESWRRYIQPRVQFIVDASSDSQYSLARPDVRTVAEHIENIRSVLNPSMADLSSLFEVSRQAIYKWLSGGSIPESEKRDQIIELSRIADTFQAVGISRAGTLLKMKTFNGRSLMELIKSRESREEHVQSLITEAKIMEASYKQSGLAESKSEPTSDWQSIISIPGSSEHI